MLTSKPTRGTEYQKNARIQTLQKYLDQEKEIDMMMKDVSSYVDSEILKVAGSDGVLRTAQLRAIQTELESITSEWASGMKTMLQSDFEEVCAITKTKWEKFLKVHVTDKKMLEVAGRSLDNLSPSIVKSAFTKVIYQDGKNLSTRIWDLQQETKKDLYTRIATGAVRGESAYDVSKDLKKYLVEPDGGKARNNALRLARNETKNIANSANTEQMLEARKITGLAVVPIYQSSNDGRTRPEHRAANGKFIVDATMELDSGLMALLGGNIISQWDADELRDEVNCRCWTIERVFNYEVKKW
ncbi:MAG: phage minor head protein [bacterium]